MKDRIILDLCGGTGAWSAPYREAGYTTLVVDPKAPDLPHGQAYHGTVAEFYAELRRESCAPCFHGVLAAPPCDHFSVSGAQYWKAKDADGRTAEALAVVDACLDIVFMVGPDWWALENPVGRLRRMRGAELGDVRLIFDPCDYGDPYTKRTLLWGRFNLPKPRPVTPIRTTTQGSWVQMYGGKSERTKRARSVTPPGFARAFFEVNP
jgi:site-specific DNA-cytosine methylase